MFLFEEFEEHGKTTSVRSVELGRDVTLESALLKVVVRSGDVGRHWGIPKARVLFPYTLRKGGQIVSRGEMAAKYPLAWDYLRANEKLLRSRESGKFDHDEWYGLMRKNLDRWQGAKVMVPYMVTSLSAFVDTIGDLYFVNVTTGGFGIRSDKVDNHYLAGLLQCPA